MKKLCFLLATALVFASCASTNMNGVRQNKKNGLPAWAHDGVFSADDVEKYGVDTSGDGDGVYVCGSWTTEGGAKSIAETELAKYIKRDVEQHEVITDDGKDLSRKAEARLTTKAGFSGLKEKEWFHDEKGGRHYYLGFISTDDLNKAREGDAR